MILGVIPARGGSKGIPRKNIKNICGKPLIAFSIEAAQQAEQLDAFLVSTDDKEIAVVAKACGAPVLMRPSDLATDEAKTISVLQHVALEKPEFQNIMVLQPTSPLRSSGLLDDCITDFLSGDYDNLATGQFCKAKEFGSHNNMRRQDYQGFFYDDGNVYILQKKLVEAGKWFGDKIFRKEISKVENFEIDDEIDFLILEMLMHKFGANK
jgi:CMP-N-acetylneuraminic acid synthetase